MEVGKAYTDWFGPGAPRSYVWKPVPRGSCVYAPFTWDMGLARTARRRHESPLPDMVSYRKPWIIRLSHAAAVADLIREMADQIIKARIDDYCTASCSMTGLCLSSIALSNLIELDLRWTSVFGFCSSLFRVNAAACLRQYCTCEPEPDDARVRRAVPIYGFDRNPSLQ